MTIFKLLGALAGFAAAWPALAYVPLRDPKLLNHPKRETVLAVPGARVVLADYALLRRDFPVLQGLTDAAIDAWLLRHVAYVSAPQAAQARVNSPIQTGAGRAVARRPRDYGRALVFEAEGGLIDAKGTGGLEPGVGGHSNGLATLGEVIREFTYEKLVRTVFTHEGSGLETVEHYAVIDWGFDVIHADGSRDPAGMILRQAHARVPERFSGFDNEAARRVELVLRPYGLTTAGAYRIGADREMINVQGTRDGAILDFGGFLAVERFEKPATNFNDHLNLIVPGRVEFVQPQVDTRVPLDLWGTTLSGIEDPKLDNPWIWSHELARYLRRGDADRRATGAHFDNLVDAYQRRLLTLPDLNIKAGSALRSLVEVAKHVH